MNKSTDTIANIHRILESLPDMAVFARVVDAGSFSAAARTLGLTPSAVSRQVARLETRLGMRLLERTTRQLRLTEAGMAAHARCQALEATAREVLQLADHQRGALPQGLVRMSVPFAYANHRIHPLVTPFLAAHPQVSVQVVATDRAVDLFKEDIDLALSITDSPPPELAGRPLEAVEYVVCASPGYLAQRGAPAHPADLARHDCLCLGEHPHDRGWRFVRGDGRKAENTTVQVSGRYAVNHSLMRLDAALGGLGIASLPGFTAYAALQAGALVRVLPGWRHETLYSGTAWLLYPPHRVLPARVRAWIDHLAAGLAASGG